MMDHEFELFESLIREPFISSQLNSSEFDFIKEKTNYTLNGLFPVSLKTTDLLNKITQNYQTDLEKFLTDSFKQIDRLIEFLSLPKSFLKKFPHLFDLQEKQFLSRPDFVINDNNPQLIDPNFSSAVGGMSQVHKFYHFSKNHDWIKILEEKSLVKINDPIEALTIFFRKNNITDLFVFDLEIQQGRYWDDTLIELKKNFALKNINFIEMFPELIEEKNDKIFHNDKPLKNILRLAVVDNIIQRSHDFEPLLVNKNVNWYGNLNEIIFWNKLFMPFFSDSQLADQFKMKWSLNYENYIPWTRHLKNSITEYKNQKVSLIDFVIENKDTIILKKGNGWLTKAVRFGVEYEKPIWIKLIKQLIGERDWIVQETVNARKFQADTPDGKYDFSIILSPYFIENKNVGYMVRTPGTLNSREFKNGLTTAFQFDNYDDIKRCLQRDIQLRPS